MREQDNVPFIGCQPQCNLDESPVQKAAKTAAMPCFATRGDASLYERTNGIIIIIIIHE